ncbi:MAG: hypothetical protein ACOC1F_00090, partial [Myxococcota bacterium]
MLPFPVYLMGGLTGWFGETPEEAPDHETIIPVDLMLTEGADQPFTAPEVPKPPEPAVPAEPPTAAPPLDAGPPPEAADAGLADVSDAGVDAGDASVPDAEMDAMPLDGASRDAIADVTPDQDAQPQDAGPVRTDAGPLDAGPGPPDAAIARAKQSDAAVPGLPDAAVAATDAGGTGRGDAAADAKPRRQIRDPVGLAGDAKDIAP